VIEGNKEDGVVVIATRPNLGTRQNRAAMSFVRMVAMTLTAVLLAKLSLPLVTRSPMLVSSGSVDFTGMGSSGAAHAAIKSLPGGSLTIRAS